ncbi:response regulator [Flaviaesturariibacter flavus]|uniref:Response regulator n=1 Tax=Flaviaesturariibacter flavus TaxID=2502780 RepID=A0A4R1BK59_9BACT|nr:response regulator [Flaviaesturariibacter flavus]TCJ17704.1 response regulator [Flaviaesturariibacter flavus]
MNIRKQVLYADDDPDDQDIMKQLFLEYPEYDLHTFGDGTDLIEHLLKFPHLVCLVILDHNMPLLSGREALQRIRLLLPDNPLPAILYTTTISPLLDAEASGLGAVPFKKPTSFSEIRESLKKMVQYCE